MTTHLNGDQAAQEADPFSAQANVNPYPIFEQIRAGGPVFFHTATQHWIITGHEESMQALSADGFITSTAVDGLLRAYPYTALTTQAKKFFRGWLALVDPPDHTRLRRLVSRAFTPRRIHDLTPKIEARVDQLIADLRATDGPVELVENLTASLSVSIIAEMLGLPEERWKWSQHTTNQCAQLLSPFTPFDPVALNKTIAEVHEYWGTLANERATNPQDDLLTAMVEAEDDGDRLSRDELIALIAFLMGAGHETVADLLGLSIIHLARNPGQRDLVRRQPELWPNAVEELLRFDTTIKMSPRVATKDIKIGDQTIRKGSTVAPILAAANRDPRKHDRPNELILSRKDPDPLSFGHGIHYCLGSALARLELQICLKKFVEAFGDYEIDESSVEWKDSVVVRGLERLVVRPK